jgi:hypothetical protein
MVQWHTNQATSQPDQGRVDDGYVKEKEDNTTSRKDSY